MLRINAMLSIMTSLVRNNNNNKRESKKDRQGCSRFLLLTHTIPYHTTTTGYYTFGGVSFCCWKTQASLGGSHCFIDEELQQKFSFVEKQKQATLLTLLLFEVSFCGETIQLVALLLHSKSNNIVVCNRKIYYYDEP